MLRKLMLANTVIYLALSLVLVSYIGIVGLVYANCFNMLLRATSCVHFTFKQYG